MMEQPEVIGINALLDRLKARCSGIGGQGKLARKLGVSASYLCQVLRDGKNPSPKILKLLGLARISGTKRYYVLPEHHCNLFPTCDCRVACRQLRLDL